MSRRFKISSKTVCVLLSIALITVQTGCYTTQRVRSVNALAIPAYQQKELLRKGLLVRVFYYDGKSIASLMGNIEAITSDEIVITLLETRTNGR